MISKEILNDLIKYIEFIDENTENLIAKENLSNEEKVLSCLSCLMEEVWETTSEIRKKLKLSFNKKKIENFKDSDLEEELWDILITFLLLCKSLKINNLDEIIQRKIKKNNDRWY